MTRDDKLTFLIAGLIVTLILWQLWTGKVLGRDWRVAATRRDQPYWYWFTILGQCVILAIFLLLDNDE
jgi:hypothetical protein